ncbi:MAG TPA: SRPBCC family protein [Thermoanaerobaculia bacterium]
MIDPRLTHASTLPARSYVDPAVLTAEQRQIFGRTWQLAAHLSQLRDRGQFITTTIAGEPLLLVRGSDDVLRAMSNVCRHRAGPVARGEGKRPVLQCGYHGWTYSLDGRLATTPEFEGVEDFDRSNCQLPQFRVEVWNDLVFVNLSPGGESLANYLGGLQTDMPSHDYGTSRLAHRKVWELDCNWKVYVDNYLEGYHIPIVHPGLFRELDYPNYRTETGKNYSNQIAPTRRPDRIRVAAGESKVRYFWLFPNLMLNVYPDNFSTNLIVPLSAERTATIFDWYFPEGAAAGVQVDETVAFSDEIQLEDIEICETVQLGLRSAFYDTGRYSPQRENGVHHFHCLYDEWMRAADQDVRDHAGRAATTRA